MSAQSEPKSWSAVLALKRILVPTDFSEESKKAFGYAAALAEEFNASVTVLFVVEIVPFVVGLEAMPMAVDTATVLASSRARLDDWIKAELPSTIRVTPLVQEGRAFSEIVRVAQTNDIDLIVLSTHGHSGLKTSIYGQHRRKSHPSRTVSSPGGAGQGTSTSFSRNNSKRKTRTEAQPNQADSAERNLRFIEARPL
jgi:nucleotide-binding universal stress UspA family protein